HELLHGGVVGRSADLLVDLGEVGESVVGAFQEVRQIAANVFRIPERLAVREKVQDLSDAGLRIVRGRERAGNGNDGADTGGQADTRPGRRSHRCHKVAQTERVALQVRYFLLESAGLILDRAKVGVSDVDTVRCADHVEIGLVKTVA